MWFLIAKNMLSHINTNWQKRNRKLHIHVDKPVSWFLMCISYRFFLLSLELVAKNVRIKITQFDSQVPQRLQFLPPRNLCQSCHPRQHRRSAVSLFQTQREQVLLKNVQSLLIKNIFMGCNSRYFNHTRAGYCNWHICHHSSRTQVLGTQASMLTTVLNQDNKLK